MDFSLDNLPSVETVNREFVAKFKIHSDYPVETKLFILSFDQQLRNECAVEVEWKDSLDFRKPANCEKKLDGNFKIQINLQYIASLHFLAHRIFSLPNFHLPGFAPSTDEPVEKIQSLQPNLIDLGIDFRMSKNLLKQILAEQLAFSMAVLVFQHELAHVLNGHFDYLFKFNDELMNSKDEAVLKNAKLSLQALEAEADRQATLNLMRILQERSKVYLESLTDVPECEPIYDHIFKNEFTISQWVAIASGLLLSFPESAWVNNKIQLNDLRHPPNYVRLSLLLNSICAAAFTKLSDEEKENASRLLKNNTFMYVIAVTASITNQSDFFNIKNLSNDMHINLCNDIYFRQQKLINEMCNSRENVRVTSSIFQNE
ncbi:MAG: hypothetical protein Q8S71_00505 [Hydrogenophaga sp.]|nr:hypothetical protein [Hydrogenophaga sp.]